MFFLDWYKEWVRIRDERRVCATCDYLKIQVEIERQFNRVLFEKLTNKSIAEITPEQYKPEPVIPKFTPWRVKKQMLEQEDARAYQIMKKREEELLSGVNLAPKEDPDVIALEKEMGLIEKGREDA